MICELQEQLEAQEKKTNKVCKMAASTKVAQKQVKGRGKAIEVGKVYSGKNTKWITTNEAMKILNVTPACLGYYADKGYINRKKNVWGNRSGYDAASVLAFNVSRDAKEVIFCK